MRTSPKSSLLLLSCCLAAIVSAVPVSAERDISLYEVVRLTGHDTDGSDSLGGAVALEGTTLVVGAGGVDSAGAVYVFERQPGNDDDWGQTAKIVPDGLETNDGFGAAVALVGDTLVATASRDDDYQGSAYIFERTPMVGGRWSQIARIVAGDGDPNDEFGYSVGASGDTVVVGAWSDDDPFFGAGSAYVFERDAGGPDAWGQTFRLTASDANSSDSFGKEVAIDGDTIVVGAYNRDEAGTASGAAYVFERGEDSGWTEVQKLISPKPQSFDYFGWSVAVDADTIAVGASGAEDWGVVFLFTRDPDKPGSWNLAGDIAAPDPAVKFGASVALESSFLVATREQSSNGRGSGYVFLLRPDQPGNWYQIARFKPSDSQRMDYFGHSAAISGRTVAVGAPWNGHGRAGAAYVFEPIIVDPTVGIGGTCPGTLTLGGTGFTPLGGVHLYHSSTKGEATIPGPCSGTQLDLANPLRGAAGAVDDRGGAVWSQDVPPEHCGRFVQMVDAVACTPSNVVQIP